MPLEIRELVIKAEILEGKSSGTEVSDEDPINNEALITECVERVMQVLNDQKER